MKTPPFYDLIFVQPDNGLLRTGADFTMAKSVFTTDRQNRSHCGTSEIEFYYGEFGLYYGRFWFDYRRFGALLQMDLVSLQTCSMEGQGHNGGRPHEDSSIHVPDWEGSTRSN